MFLNLILLLLFLFFYLAKLNLRLLSNINDEKRAVDVVTQTNTDGKYKRDCVTENHYCVSQQDCNDICLPGNTSMRCNMSNLMCEPQPYAIDSSQSNVVCEKKHGSFLAMAVNQLAGASWYCVRTLTNLFNDEEVKREHVCNGGILNTDTTLVVPQIHDCTCPNGKILVTKQNDPNTPRCVEEKFVSFYPSLQVS